MLALFDLLATLPSTAQSTEPFVNWLALSMEQAFYPMLLGVLVIASLGLPIPEDIPLIAAGFILKTSPNAASWPGAITVAMIGIMSGDIVLYSMGRRWGRDVVNHKTVAWMVTPERYATFAEKFHERGIWFVFVGRFFMGVRAAMCVVAGATHFPFWKFILADFAGALLSVPFFILLGYLFAEALPELKRYIKNIEYVLLAVVLLAAVSYFAYRTLRKRRSAIDAGDTDR